jgi:hypothetical protein
MVESQQGFRINAAALSEIRQQVFVGKLQGGGGMEAYNKINALAVPTTLDNRITAPIKAVQAEDALLVDAKFACKMFVKKILHDPDSAEFDNHKSFPASFSDGLYQVQVNLRAKNGFNALRQMIVNCKAVHKDGNWVAVSLKELQ